MSLLADPSQSIRKIWHSRIWSDGKPGMGGSVFVPPLKCPAVGCDCGVPPVAMNRGLDLIELRHVAIIHRDSAEVVRATIHPEQRT
jgi:hypothetical protein